MTTRKMITLTFRRVLESFRSSGFELEMYVAPVIPRATAAMRAMRIRCLFDVMMEMGFLGTTPLTISLCGNQKVSSVTRVVHCRCDLPVKNEGVGRIEQTEESNAVDDQLSNNQP